MSLFRLNASIRVEGSHSRALADIVEEGWRANHPGEDVVVRDIGLDPIPATAWPTVVSTLGVPEDKWTEQQRAAVALATEAADQLLAADAFLFAVPLATTPPARPARAGTTPPRGCAASSRTAGSST